MKDFVKSVQPYLRKVVVPTFVEVATLIVWFLLVLAKKDALAIAVLAGGLIVEHLVAQAIYNVKKFFASGGEWVLVSLFETLVWAVWLFLAKTEKNPLAAFVILGVALLVEHTVSENILEGRAILARAVASSVVGFTAIEIANAYVLLQVAVPVVGGIVPVMLVLSLVEHALQFRVADQKK